MLSVFFVVADKDGTKAMCESWCTSNVEHLKWYVHSKTISLFPMMDPHSCRCGPLMLVRLILSVGASVEHAHL
jgi:hypothetical protein